MWKKSFLMLFSLLFFLTMLTSCDWETDMDASSGYVFLPLDGFTLMEPEIVWETLYHEGKIYYLYFTSNTEETSDSVVSRNIVVAAKEIDGTQTNEIFIQLWSYFLNIVGFHIGESGEFILMLQEVDFEREKTILWYQVYDIDGNQIFSKNILETELEIFIAGTRFGPDGDFAVLAHKEHSNLIFLWNTSLEFQGDLELGPFAVISYGADGSLLVFDYHHEIMGFALQELYLDHMSLGSISTLPLEMDVFGVYRGIEGIDVFINDGLFLYSYVIGENTLEKVLSWDEVGVDVSNSYHLSFLEDGRIAMFTTNFRNTSGRWETEFVVLSPLPPEDVVPQELIRLGGILLRDVNFLQAVRDFNRQNLHYRIEVVDYWNHWEGEDLSLAVERFVWDIMVGQTPDILLFTSGEHFDTFEALVRQEFFVDLYDLIDADLILNRDDFFPNMLQGRETVDGSLPLLGNGFTLLTIIGESTHLPPINIWDLETALELLETAIKDGISYPLGEELAGANFLNLILQVSADMFIDQETNTANFEHEAFIRLLYLAKDIQGTKEFGDSIWLINDLELIARGEQTLAVETFASPHDLQKIVALIDEPTFLGFPRENGGVHLVHMANQMGIYRNSPHIEQAWEFMRGFLLPGAYTSNIFPMRIDDFEAMLAGAMIPHLEPNRYGEYIEMPVLSLAFAGGGNVDIYTMTEAEAILLRSIANSAFSTSQASSVMIAIIGEELLPFLANDRTASDTARIIQNRAQIYLSERSR